MLQNGGFFQFKVTDFDRTFTAELFLKVVPVFYGHNIKKDRKKVYIYGKYQLKLYLFSFE